MGRFSYLTKRISKPFRTSRLRRLLAVLILLPFLRLFFTVSLPYLCSLPVPPSTTVSISDSQQYPPAHSQQLQDDISKRPKLSSPREVLPDANALSEEITNVEKDGINVLEDKEVKEVVDGDGGTLKEDEKPVQDSERDSQNKDEEAPRGAEGDITNDVQKESKDSESQTQEDEETVEETGKNPTSICYHDPNKSFSETVCVHTSFHIPKSTSNETHLQPVLTSDTHISCRHINRKPIPESTLTTRYTECHSGFASKQSKNIVLRPPLIPDSSSSIIGNTDNYLKVPGTTLFLPMDSIDVNIGHCARRFLFANMIIKTRVYLGEKDEKVDRVIVVAAKRQLRSMWEKGGKDWHGGALHVMFQKVAGMKDVIIIGRDENERKWMNMGGIWTELGRHLEKNLKEDVGSWRDLMRGLGTGVKDGSKMLEGKDGVVFEKAVVIGTYDVRMSIPDQDKGFAQEGDENGHLASEMFGIHDAAFDRENNESGERRPGTIVYIRRSKKTGKRHMKDPIMEKKMMYGLHRAAKASRGNPLRVKVLDDKDSLTFEQQFEFMRDADVIVGVHGAGLAAMMWARPNSTLVEIMPYKFDHSMYRSSQQSGVRYVKVGIRSGGEYTKMEGFNGRAPTYQECAQVAKCREFYRDQDVQLTDEDLDEIETEVTKAVKWAELTRKH
eukprot:Plantae.Rhodophyta-Hildenbrandia_rubra.ctg6332.p1 GENE.Plantae.Rhodophyta-Hildenbrandia_rubra.ctg6332~~Plantae.Rhodophyta-Hildenbrandia_rubra.ctg6332.p1  ORF type:complete len:669 (+),score=113.99 Plantae.Rhodophyta-Hildenbrandia_rubra.ctg6332:3093-5099(+)